MLAFQYAIVLATLTLENLPFPWSGFTGVFLVVSRPLRAVTEVFPGRVQRGLTRCRCRRCCRNCRSSRWSGLCQYIGDRSKIVRISGGCSYVDLVVVKKRVGICSVLTFTSIVLYTLAGEDVSVWCGPIDNDVLGFCGRSRKRKQNE